MRCFDKINKGVSLLLAFNITLSFVLFFLIPKNDWTLVLQGIVLCPAVVTVVIYAILKIVASTKTQILGKVFDISFIIVVVASLSYAMQWLQEKFELKARKEQAEKVFAMENADKEEKKLREQCKVGNPKALYELGAKCIWGLGRERNVEMGLKCLKESANCEYQPAQILLGKIYSTGNGVEKEIGKAESWFKKAASLGNVGAASFDYEAENLLLDMYMDEGRNLEADKLCNDMVKNRPSYELDSIYYKGSLILLRLNQITKAEKMACKAFYEGYIQSAGIILANIYISQKKIHGAEQLLLSISKRGNKAAQRKLITLYEDNGCMGEADYWKNVFSWDVEQLEKLQKIWRTYNDR